MNPFRGPVVPIVLTVVVAGASTFGVVALRGHETASEKQPAVPVRGAAWSVDGAPNSSNLSALTGTWVTDKIVVRGGVDGLHAYQRADGKEAWELPAPTDGGQVCWMSALTPGGVGTVAFSASTTVNETDCKAAETIDLASGKVISTSQDGGSIGVGDRADQELHTDASPTSIAVRSATTVAAVATAGTAAAGTPSAAGAAVVHAPEAHVITMPTPTNPRASLSHTGVDGKLVVDAYLAKSVTDFLVKYGPSDVLAYGDVNDLVLVAADPFDETALVDVR